MPPIPPHIEPVPQSFATQWALSQTVPSVVPSSRSPGFKGEPFDPV